MDVMTLRRGLIALTLGLWSLTCAADETPIVGTWELTYVAPLPIMDSVPQGITNTKLHFTADGKLFSLAPDAVLTEGSPSATYTFDGKQLTVTEDGHSRYSMTASFPDGDTLLLRPQYSSQRTLKRLGSPDIKVEPKSLELVELPGAPTVPVTYDSTDHSGEPLDQRLLGVWEVMEVRNVPGELPPYGFLNDVWTITKQKVTVSRRVPPAVESVAFRLKKGHFASSGIGLDAPQGSRIDWKPSFDTWGHLILDSKICSIVLKLVSKDTSLSPQLPLKVVLLTPR